jgi:serine/threonine protein kinase
LAERNIQDLTGAKGTLLYMAPEGKKKEGRSRILFFQYVFFFFFFFPVMMGAPFNEKADVYSFGIVLWEILTFTEPFPHHNNVPGFVKAVAHEGERPVIPPGTPNSLASLMQVRRE